MGHPLPPRGSRRPARAIRLNALEPIPLPTRRRDNPTPSPGRVPRQRTGVREGSSRGLHHSDLRHETRLETLCRSRSEPTLLSFLRRTWRAVRPLKLKHAREIAFAEIASPQRRDSPQCRRPVQFPKQRMGLKWGGDRDNGSTIVIDTAEEIG